MADDVKDLMAGERFIRQVGRRRRPPRSTATSPGAPPTPEAIAAWTRMAQYRTRVPKGVFVYASHEEANRDWERWRIDGMRAHGLTRADG